jgi:hypothetical protein
MWIAAPILVVLVAIAAFTATGIAITDAILPYPEIASEASGLAGLTGLFVAALLTLPLIALTAGFLQWLVLRWYVPWAGRWMVATIIGLILGIGIGIPVGRGALGWGVIGAVMGLAQWVVIRRHVSNAYWWIPASAFGMFVGALLTPDRLLSPGGVVITGLVQIAIQLLIPVLFWAILTGLTLRTLSQHSTPAI